MYLWKHKKELTEAERIQQHYDEIFGMANLTPRRTGLSAQIWSDHNGRIRNVSHKNTPRAKISIGSYVVSVSISEDPKIMAESKHGTKSQKSVVKEAMEYIARNHDLFLKHYLDDSDDFGDEELFNALRDRKEYR